MQCAEAGDGTGWLTSSKGIADVPRGDGRKHDRRHERMTGQSEAASVHLASLVVAILSAIKRQMILCGASKVGELHFAGPVPEWMFSWESDGGCTSHLTVLWDARVGFR